MPRRYQAIWGFGVVSVLSSDTMGQSPSRVLVHWHTRFGPEPTHGPDTAYPQFRPLKKALFSTASAPPFWFAETWFLLRNLGYYSPLKPCSESGHFRKILFLAFLNPWLHLWRLALIDLNAKAYNGDTALMIASQEGYQDIVQLIKAKLNLSILV